MGVNLRELVIAREIKIEDLAGKTVIFDSHNLLYQFLSTIRQPDGTLLMDRQGHVTSHLNGLISRTAHFLEIGMKPAFVFDGRPPNLKAKEIERRRGQKEAARSDYDKAALAEDKELMRKFASRTTSLTREMIDDAKVLIRLLGCPIVLAPSEGEAQAVHIMKREGAYAVISQDFDSLLYGADRLVRNLSIAGRRRHRHGFVDVKPELVLLKDTLESLGISHEQLIVLSILVGTDYNPGGIRGIGPKKALALVKQHKDLDSLFVSVKWDEFSDISWKSIFQLFTDMPVTDEYSLSWNKPDKEGIIKFLCAERDFSQERVKPFLEMMSPKQKGLPDFL
jgi:flap endonuclease-1